MKEQTCFVSAKKTTAPLRRHMLWFAVMSVLLAGCGDDQRSVPISGYAVDCQKGSPLPNTVILMETLNKSKTARGFLRRTMTNEQGYFVLPGATGYEYRIEATQPGYHPAIVQTEPRGNVKVRLLRGASKDPTYGCQTAGACRPPHIPASASPLPACPEE